MPLGEPPSSDRLRELPALEIAHGTLHRVYRPKAPGGNERSPWWFASIPQGSDSSGGRFDLPTPNGSCYLARSAVAAVLEVFQDYGNGVLPEEELRIRRRVEVVAPDTAPPAADLTDPRAYGIAHVTAALWAGGDEDTSLMAAMRVKTQRWALALHEADWRSLHHGIQHDPSGLQRAVTLFDRAGQHVPYGDETWDSESHMHDLVADSELLDALAGYGLQVTRSDVDIPIVGLDESGTA